MKNLKNKKGFTIVELVIVIAVIAILAAVLIPTFSGVINDAKENAALQEARNLYTQYIAENATNADVNIDDIEYVTVDGFTFQVSDWTKLATAKDDAANVLTEKDFPAENDGE